MSIWAFAGALGWGMFFGLGFVFFKEKEQWEVELSAIERKDREYSSSLEYREEDYVKDNRMLRDRNEILLNSLEKYKRMVIDLEAREKKYLNKKIVYKVTAPLRHNTYDIIYDTDFPEYIEKYIEYIKSEIQEDPSILLRDDIKFNLPKIIDSRVVWDDGVKGVGGYREINDETK